MNVKRNYLNLKDTSFDNNTGKIAGNAVKKNKK